MKPTHLILGLLMATAIPAIVQAEEAIATEGATVGRWTMDLEAAKKISAERNLPLLLNFTGSDWCGWCKLMDKEVFAKEPWKQYATENTLLVTIDFPRDKSRVPQMFVERNKALKEEYGIRGYPTYVVLDSDGKTKIGQLGAGRDKTPESFIAEFENVTRMRASSIEAYCKANPGQAEAYKSAIQNLKESEKALTDWLATKPERSEETSKKLVELREAIEAARDELAKF